MSMKDCIQKLDGFLKVNERSILTHAGKIASNTEKELAEKEYNKFHIKKIKSEDKKGAIVINSQNKSEFIERKRIKDD